MISAKYKCEQHTKDIKKSANNANLWNLKVESLTLTKCIDPYFKHNLDTQTWHMAVYKGLSSYSRLQDLNQKFMKTKV